MQASIGTFGVNGFLGVRVAVRLPISIFGGTARSSSAVAQAELEPSHQAAIEVSRDLVTQARPHFEPHSDRPPSLPRLSPGWMQDVFVGRDGKPDIDVSYGVAQLGPRTDRRPRPSSGADSNTTSRGQDSASTTLSPFHARLVPGHEMPSTNRE